jgi:maltose alpha-D-glucosyltransferase/alpha-amylase
VLPTPAVLPYPHPLAGHGFDWFELSRPAPEPVEEHETWEAAGTSSVADSLLASGVVHAAEEIPGDSDTRTGDDVPTSGGTP